jgi:hypothetical protein
MTGCFSKRIIKSEGTLILIAVASVQQVPNLVKEYQIKFLHKYYPESRSKGVHIYLKNSDTITGSSVQKETPYHIQTLNSYL